MPQATASARPIFMPVPVMQVGPVGMGVGEGFVPVGVGVGRI